MYEEFMGGRVKKKKKNPKCQRKYIRIKAQHYSTGRIVLENCKLVSDHNSNLLSKKNAKKN